VDVVGDDLKVDVRIDDVGSLIGCGV
jgi:hypothetical protein